MKWLLGMSLLVALVATAHSQELIQDKTAEPPVVIGSSAPAIHLFDSGRRPPDFLKGNRDFPNFIGFISNPIQSIEPRSTTEIMGMFASGWAAGNNAFLPSGTMQVYGGGPYSIALSERFCFGICQGGWGTATFSRDRETLREKLGLPVREADKGGTREGWLNLGGFAQYTLIADVERQFLLTAGMRWEAPMGATQLFQGGANPPYLAPYLTVGKEYGCYHVLATAGYEFAAGSGDVTTSTFYFNIHLDRKIGWIYPLVEFNCSYHTSHVDLSLATPHHGIIDLGGFSSTGNTVAVAVGANAVLVPGRLELGAVYSRPIAAQDHFNTNGMLVKMVWRY